MRDRDLAVGAVDQERLRVLQPALTGGRVAGVADRQMPGQPSSARFVERVGDLPHRPRDAHLAPVGGDDARALLAAMLQRVQAEVGEVRRLGMPEDPEDAAFVFEFIEHGP